MSANDRQVGGSHYKRDIQHWDYVWANDLDYFQAQIIKYVTRWKDKNGMEDLAKARHFLDKYMELQMQDKPTPSLEEGAEQAMCSCDSSPHTEECAFIQMKLGYEEEECSGAEPDSSYVNQDQTACACCGAPDE